MPLSWTLIDEDETPLDASAIDVDEPARDFELDTTTRDLVVPFRLIRGRPAIAQNIWLRVSMFLGEWHLDTDDGTDWWSILGKKYDANLARSILQERILGTDGVRDLIELDMSFDRGTRAFESTAAVTTDLGELRVLLEGAV